MNILACDCATKTGWATQIITSIESGVQDFSLKRGESPGMRWIHFNKWLSTMRGYAFISRLSRKDNTQVNNGVFSYDLIVYEQAHHRGGAATNLCVGLTTRLEEFAAQINAETMPVHTATLKKFATGSGRASKDDMMAWFRKQTGRNPIDDNEADAYALLMYAKQELGV